jgi:hypothetical protein
MDFGFDELFALLIYYLPSLGCWLLGTIAVTTLLFLAKRKRGERLGWRLIGFILLASGTSWLVYFAATARTAYAITDLDSEEDDVAEAAYHNYFDMGLNKAVSLAMSDHQRGNVRFYAACRIADLLVTNDDRTKADILERVDDAPAFNTDFFGTNSLTSGFFIPGHVEGPFTVREIIERHLAVNQKQGNK